MEKEQETLEQLDELGIRFQPNDDWRNTNQRYYDEKERRASTVLDPLYFYVGCILMVGAVYGVRYLWRLWK